MTYAVQITIEEYLDHRVFLAAKQIYIQEMYFGDAAFPTYTGGLGYGTIAQGIPAQQARTYTLFLEVEKLLKQMAKYRKIKGFKPAPSQVYGLMSGRETVEGIFQ